MCVFAAVCLESGEKSSTSEGADCRRGW
uniref:Uncharacterized protein n=1 Tax=Anguilla anguilla TaxID=7936 RepID=A0A0E9S3S9_ANGAN